MATPQERRSENKKYLNNIAGHILHKMDVDLLIEKPDDIVRRTPEMNAIPYLAERGSSDSFNTTSSTLWYSGL